jgi:biotin carboxyl carrier protein
MSPVAAFVAPTGLSFSSLRSTQSAATILRPRRARAANVPRACATATGEPAVAVTGMAPDAQPSASAITSMADVQMVIELAKEFSLADFRLQDGGVTVEISMPGGRGFKDGKLADLPAPTVMQSAVAPAPASFAPATSYSETSEDEEYAQGGEDDDINDMSEYEIEEEVADADGIFSTDFVVTSNRVGFFFSGGKGKPPLVNVGDRVAFNQPVCIIEQLGQQYVYLTEVSGTVVKIFAEDGDPIMYGSKVMVIRPSSD